MKRKIRVMNAAREELARRELARRKTVFRLKYFMPAYQIEPVHSYVGELLDQFMTDYLAGKAPRLELNMPPQHGKSTLVNGLVAGLAGKIRRKTTIPICSYGADLAERSSTEILNWLLSPEGNRIYPNLLSNKNYKKTASNWQTNHGVTILARGIDGALTGRPADILILDDLHKDYQSYLSRAKREALKNWLKTVAGTRINNETAILQIMTRWGVGDASDMIREYLPGDFVRYNLPALAGDNDVLGRKNGDSLWELKHSRKRLLETRERIGDLEFYSIYQGKPPRRIGIFFKTSAWKITESWDYDGYQKIRYWDLGFTKAGHKTSGAKIFLKPDNSLWIEHIKNIDSLDWPDIKPIIKQYAKLDGYGTTIGIEATGTQVGYGQEMQRELGVLGYRVILRKHKPDKEADAGVWQSRQWAGMVYLRSGTWTEKFIESAKRFPGDDIDEVDAISGGLAMFEGYATLPQAEQGWE